ncbi:extracellular solute-binding protein [Bradyrhizobium sp. LMTR 3]|uniref:extracellular solute-binding protein n=1 Tax=Bradyrhizobium sp. LMTR 3 TaxID=189873 RepID=UPI000810EADD|nr:extracellular solute-binding protein [Bradyrhizobium sp. LMTR 3]OCK57407.1 hypothetical protein LMTR3_21420 [Bradyrhizobium sp. LMTR 3]
MRVNALGPMLIALALWEKGRSNMPATSAARAAETITAIDWGGHYIESIKAIAAEQSDVDFNWQLHIGGAITIMSRIKELWPHAGIDLLAGWDGTYPQIAQEGWAEPVTLAKVPNLVDVPSRLLVRDRAGNIVNIPRTMTQAFWFCRDDITPFEITRLDDLLDPRLKGKICIPTPTANLNMQMVSMALNRGGDERRMEPAWDFMKELARIGNIGRVWGTLAELNNSIISGETCVAFESGAVATNLARKFKIRYLIKQDPKTTGFWTFLFDQGWCVLKGKHTDAAFKFANFAIGPEKNAEFNRLIGGVPVNMKAEVADEMKPLVFSNEEIGQFTYRPDWAYLTEHTSAWMKRWGEEIVPLL